MCCIDNSWNFAWKEKRHGVLFLTVENQSKRTHSMKGWEVSVCVCLCVWDRSYQRSLASGLWMYVEKLETTFGNGQLHIQIKILASLENLEEPAAVGPPPHMAAICCRQWRLSPFPRHVFLSLPQFLPLCRLSPSARTPACLPCVSYLLASAGIWIRNCLTSPNILYFLIHHQG